MCLERIRLRLGHLIYARRVKGQTRGRAVDRVGRCQNFGRLHIIFAPRWEFRNDRQQSA